MLVRGAWRVFFIKPVGKHAAKTAIGEALAIPIRKDFESGVLKANRKKGRFAGEHSVRLLLTPKAGETQKDPVNLAFEGVLRAVCRHAELYQTN